MNYKRKTRRRFFLLVRSRTPPISSEFRRGGGLNTPNPPSRYATDTCYILSSWHMNACTCAHTCTHTHTHTQNKQGVCCLYVNTSTSCSWGQSPPETSHEDGFDSQYYSDMDINFRLPEAAVFLIAGIFLRICNKGKYSTEIKIFYRVFQLLSILVERYTIEKVHSSI